MKCSTLSLFSNDGKLVNKTTLKPDFEIGTGTTVVVRLPTPADSTHNSSMPMEGHQDISFHQILFMPFMYFNKLNSNQMLDDQTCEITERKVTIPVTCNMHNQAFANRHDVFAKRLRIEQRTTYHISHDNHVIGMRYFQSQLYNARFWARGRQPSSLC